MMYPWKKPKQQQNQKPSSQRSSRPGGPIRSSSGYTTMKQDNNRTSSSNNHQAQQHPLSSPTRNSRAADARSLASSPTSINSQNPHDGMMDSVFNFIFDNDDVTVTTTQQHQQVGGGGYLGDDCDGTESIEICSKRDTRPDRNEEQGFEMQKGAFAGAFGRKSKSTSKSPNNNFPSSARSAAMSSSAGSTAFATTIRDDDYYDDDYDYYNDDLSTGSRSNRVRIKPKHQTPGLVATLYAEFFNPLGQDWYAVRDTVTGRRLDFAASFAPPPTARVLSLKLASTVLVLGTMAFSLWDFYRLLQKDNDNHAIQNLYLWLSYFTNWSLLLASMYQLFSLSNTLCTTRGMAFAPPAEHVTGRVKWTWILFTMALHAQVLAALLFWIAWFQPSQYPNVFWTTTNSSTATTTGSNNKSLTQISSFLDPVSWGFYYLTLVPHSLTCLAVAVDGLVVNRIPLRLMHWWGWILGYNLLYIVWTMIRSLVLYQHDFYSNSIPLTESGYLYHKYSGVMNNHGNNGASSIVSSPSDNANVTAPYFNLDNYTQAPYFNLDNYTQQAAVDSINNVDGSGGDGIGNGDDAVYGDLLNWRDDWPLAAIQSVILCFAISPVIYILLWILSLYQGPCFCCSSANDRRRYVKNHLDITIAEVGPFSSSSQRYYAQQQQQDRDERERQPKTTSIFGVSFW